MNEISQLSVVCTHITHDASGKAKETKRRFTNLNTSHRFRNQIIRQYHCTSD